jgi:hypothetical protein
MKKQSRLEVKQSAATTLLLSETPLIRDANGCLFYRQRQDIVTESRNLNGLPVERQPKTNNEQRTEPHFPLHRRRAIKSVGNTHSKIFSITLYITGFDLYSHPPEKRKRKKKRNQNRSGKVYGRRNQDSG